CLVARCASKNEAFERRKLILCTVAQEPCADFIIAMQGSDGKRGAAVGARLMNVRSVRHEQLNHSDIPPLRCNVKRRVARLSPGKVRISSVFQQPTYTCKIFGSSKAQNVT